MDKDLVLNHIDKLYSTLEHVWDSMNRILFVELLLSLIIIALSTDVISADEGIEISGFKFKTSLAVFLSAGALIISALYIAFSSQMLRAYSLHDEIIRLYESIGYTNPKLAHELINAFESPSIYMAVINPMLTMKRSASRFIKVYNLLTTVITFFGLILLIPIGAQVAAGLRVAALIGWRWWVILAYVLLIIITVSSLIHQFFAEAYRKWGE